MSMLQFYVCVYRSLSMFMSTDVYIKPMTFIAEKHSYFTIEKNWLDFYQDNVVADGEQVPISLYES